MYIVHALIDGLKVLSFDKQVIRRVSKEKSLEDIFLSTLFVNYMVVLVCFLVIVAMGGQLYLEDRLLNMPVLMGLLLMYPFAFNIVVYAIYSLFGLMAELVNTKNHVRPLLSTGFHSAIAYAPILYGIAVITTASITLGLILFTVFAIYFLVIMFYIISTIYKYSFAQSMMVLLIPLLIAGIALTILSVFVPQISQNIIAFVFA
ncbi:MAG: hypothetical protein LAT82_01915 [Nanoarchaeota archaeon]|nr:hypothetical protein [Nanoarchaeota archaeon]